MTAHHGNEISNPMQGVRVLDLTHVMAGPACTMSLGDMGAEIIKIEEPGKGDMSRSIYDAYQGGEGALFLNLNCSKKSVTLNLKRAQPAGRASWGIKFEENARQLCLFPSGYGGLECPRHTRREAREHSAQHRRHTAGSGSRAANGGTGRVRSSAGPAEPRRP